ncbi:MAG: hypothetical protein R3E95_05925 [Thiolinea sp.]
MRNAALPLMTWDFANVPVGLPRPRWWIYAALALLLILSGIGIFYFRRYRHPLVLELGANPPALLHLPLEQLPEARQRLQQTRRLNTVIDNAEVSPTTLEQAIVFRQAGAEQKAQMLATRLSAQLSELELPLALRERGLGGEGALYTLNLPATFPSTPTASCSTSRLTPRMPSLHLKAILQASRITLIIGPDIAYQRKLLNTTQDLGNKYIARAATSPNCCSARRQTPPWPNSCPNNLP